jgi:hypothetical protein
MMRRIVPLLFASASLAAPLAAQAPASAASNKRPDFSGMWILDPTKSQAKGMPPAMALQVKTDSGRLSYTRIAVTSTGERRSTLRVNWDGSPTKNTFKSGAKELQLIMSGSWEGPVFVVKSKGAIGEAKSDQTDRWSLDPDGKTLHFDSSVVVGTTTTVAKLAFTKKQ